MKRYFVKIFVFFSIIASVTSCLEREEIPVSDFVSVESSQIIFGGGGISDDIIITRSGETAAPETKVSKMDLLSENGKISLPVAVEVKQDIHRSAGTATKAPILDNVNAITELDAWCIFTQYGDDNGILQRDLYRNNEETDDYLNASPFGKQADGIFYPKSGYGPYMWQKEDGNWFNFYTVTPVQSGLKANINLANNAVTFDYTVPASASQQKDILIASPDQVPGNYGQSVPLTFKHIMAAVNVKVGKSVPEGTIKSIKFTGVYDNASYYPDSNEWTNRKITEDENGNIIGGEFIVDIPENGIAINGNSTGENITTVETSFMMIPQQLESGAKIIVEFEDPTTGTHTLEASLQGDVWEMNTTTNYLINIDPNYNITIVPLDKVLDSHYIITKVEISSAYPWELTAVANDDADVSVLPEAQVNTLAKQGFWTDKVVVENGDGSYSETSTSARGDDTCEGPAGEGQIVYVFIPENVSGETRNITLTVTGGGVEKELSLTQNPVIWMDSKGNNNTVDYWGCELLIEGGQVPWGFCWDGLTAIFILKQGGASYNPDTDEYGQGQIPKGQRDKILPAMEVAGIDVEKLTSGDKNYYIQVADKGQSEFFIKVDLSKISNIGIADSDNSGFQNTFDLYHFEGISILSQLLDFCLAWGDISNPDGRANMIQNSIDYAAMYAMKRNRFHYFEKDITIDNQIITMVLPVIFDADINWYLPAKDQFPVFMNTNWGQQFSFNDLYWTSTLYKPETGTDNAHSYSYLNGIETVSHRNDKYLTFALRRFTTSSEVVLPDLDDIIKPGDDIGDNNDGQNPGGGFEKP